VSGRLWRCSDALCTHRHADSRAIRAIRDDSLEATVFLPAPGDADGNRDVNGFDIQAILSANKFGKPLPAIWTEGDFTGDGFVNGFDIQAILSANLLGKGPYTVGPLGG
jgi:hypothetical protein